MSMDDGDIDAVISQLNIVKESVSNLESLLEPLLSKNIDDVIAQLTDIDAANLYAMIAYVLDTLYFIYLRIDGVSVKDHVVMDELTRVRKSFARIKEVGAKLEAREKARIEAEVNTKKKDVHTNEKSKIKKNVLENNIKRVEKNNKRLKKGKK